MPLIAIGDGHGLHDTPGKCSPKFEDGTFMKENEFNKPTANYLEEYLKYNNFNTLQVAPTDEDISLEDRVKLANSNNADLYISIHANAAGDGITWNDANGIETFVYKLGTETAKVGKIIQDNLIEDTGLKDRGLKEANFYVLTYTKMKAVLVECGFMTNKDEVKLLINDKYRRKCAKSIAKSICQYYGKEFKDIDVNNNENNNTNTNINNKYNPQVIKERVYSENNQLKYYTGDYSKKATDVRWIKFDKDKIRLEFVYEKNKKVSELVKKYNADYGFNFPYFWNGQILGNSKDKNKIISSAYGKTLKWNSFGWKDNKFEIGKLNIKDNWDFLVSGSPLLLENGKFVYEDSIINDETANDIAYSRCQRTFVGIDNEGNLILAVCDGRSKFDQGLNIQEMALFMKDKGASISLVGDGGGSAILSTQDGVLNANRNNERITHHAILVYLLNEKNQGSDNVTLVGKKVQDETEIFYNNEELNDKVIIIDGKSYVPVRELCQDKLGLEVIWDGKVHVNKK